MIDQEGAPLAADKATEYRLPSNVVPERYEISLTPDLRAFTFAGEENVAVRVIAATAEVVLNALELEIDRVSAERGAFTVTGKAALEPRTSARASPSIARWNRASGRCASRFAASSTTSCTASIAATTKTPGYDPSGREHAVRGDRRAPRDPLLGRAGAQGELQGAAGDRRRPERFFQRRGRERTSLGGGKKEIVYKETIKMSTYLLAFIVGEFEVTEPTDAGTPLRVAHVPGKRALTAWAREIGAFSLKWFANYYELPYPGDKLDLIAIPDFASGAMENLARSRSARPPC